MKRIFLYLLALAALSSCSKDTAQTPGTTDGRIRIVAGVAETRAVSDASTGLAGASFVVKEGGATAPTSFAGGTLYTGDVAAATGEVTFTSTPAPAYNLSDANAWFAAYAPGGALTSNAIEWTIDGKTDIMVTNDVWDAGKYTAPITTGLNFNHRLSQVEVICQGVSGVTAPVIEAVWGKITKIEFVGAPAKMKYDLSATPTISTSGSADLPLLAKYDGTALSPLAIPANGSTTVNAVAMTAPVAATATEAFLLKVTTSGAVATPTTPIEVEVPVTLSGTASAMVAGHKHVVTLTFRADVLKIEAKASTVENWTDGTSGGNNAVKPVPPAVGDYYYSDGTYSTAPESGKTPVGMIFWVDETNSDKFKIISTDEPDQNWDSNTNDKGKLRIGTKNINVGYGVSITPDKIDGSVNMAAMKVHNPTLADYAAFRWCDSRTAGGSGWYLPALNELQYLCCAYNGADPVTWDYYYVNVPTKNDDARSKWNKRLSDAGMTEISKDIYWSSSDYYDGGRGHLGYSCLNFDSHNLGGDDATWNYFVRCVKAIN